MILSSRKVKYFKSNDNDGISIAINKIIKSFIKLKYDYLYRNEGFLEIKREILKKYPKFLILNFLRIAIFRLGNKNYFSKVKILENFYIRALQDKSITCLLYTSQSPRD